jgi:hypothetical protein
MNRVLRTIESQRVTLGLLLVKNAGERVRHLVPKVLQGLIGAGHRQNRHQSRFHGHDQI